MLCECACVCVLWPKTVAGVSSLQCPGRNFNWIPGRNSCCSLELLKHFWICHKTFSSQCCVKWMRREKQKSCLPLCGQGCVELCLSTSLSPSLPHDNYEEIKNIANNGKPQIMWAWHLPIVQQCGSQSKLINQQENGQLSTAYVSACQPGCHAHKQNCVCPAGQICWEIFAYPLVLLPHCR